MTYLAENKVSKNPPLEFSEGAYHVTQYSATLVLAPMLLDSGLLPQKNRVDTGEDREDPFHR